MEIKIKTSVENMENAHFLLNMAIESFESNPENYKKLNISKSGVNKAKKYLQASTKALIKDLQWK